MLRDEPILRVDHVLVVIAGKYRAHAVRRFVRGTVADCVRQNDVVTRRGERLPRPEQLAAESGSLLGH